MRRACFVQGSTLVYHFVQHPYKDGQVALDCLLVILLCLRGVGFIQFQHIDCRLVKFFVKNPDGSVYDGPCRQADSYERRLQWENQ